jgi:hypothetical protein
MWACVCVCVRVCVGGGGALTSIASNRAASSGSCDRMSSDPMKMDSRLAHVRCTSSQISMTCAEGSDTEQSVIVSVVVHQTMVRVDGMVVMVVVVVVVVAVVVVKVKEGMSVAPGLPWQASSPSCQRALGRTRCTWTRADSAAALGCLREPQSPPLRP